MNNLQTKIKNLTELYIRKNLSNPTFTTPYFVQVEKRIDTTSLNNLSPLETSKVLIDFDNNIKNLNLNLDSKKATIISSQNDTYYSLSYVVRDITETNIVKFINNCIVTVVNELLSSRRTYVSGSTELERILSADEKLETFIENIIKHKMYTRDKFYSKANIIMVKLFMEEKIDMNDLNDLVDYSS